MHRDAWLVLHVGAYVAVFAFVVNALHGTIDTEVGVAAGAVASFLVVLALAAVERVR